MPLPLLFLVTVAMPLLVGTLTWLRSRHMQLHTLLYRRVGQICLLVAAWDTLLLLSMALGLRLPRS